VRLGPTTFRIFDAFPDEIGRQAHLAGRLAAALLARSRLIASGSNVTLDAAVAATVPGAPTDIAAGEKRVAVVDGGGGISLVTQFIVDDNGDLTQTSQTPVAAPINGIGIVER